MLKRKSIILSVLVVAFLGCSRSTQIANAEEEIKDNFRPGTAHIECKVLEKNPPLAIRVKRNLKSLCAEEVRICIDKSLECKECGEPEPIVEAKGEK